MARIPTVDRLADADRDRLVADILNGDLSWRALSRKYGIAEATLRGFAKTGGLVRNPTRLKRELVAGAMSKPEGSADAAAAVPPTRAEIEAAAGEDARDMTLALRSARAALVLVAKKLQAAQVNTDLYTPREIKVLSESVAVNVSTIRMIRGLDAILRPDDLRSLSEDDLQAIAAGKMPVRH